MAGFADATPEPAETRVSPQLGPTGTGDLGELIRLLIPDDPTTGPVPIPPPSPDTGPLGLPPIDGPFLAAGGELTGPHTIPLGYLHGLDPDVPAAAPSGAGEADTAPPGDQDDVTAPASAIQGLGLTIAAGAVGHGSAAPTRLSTAGLGADARTARQPEADGSTPDGAESDASVPRPRGVELADDGFAVVGVLEHRRGRPWTRWLWAHLPMPASSSLAGRPFSRHWPRALRWSLDMSWERALRRPSARRWLPAVDWDETMDRPPGRYLLPVFVWPSAPRRSAARRWPAVGRASSRPPAWARGDVDRRFTPVYAVAFSPDGRRLATASGDGLVRLWDVTDPAVPTRMWEVSTRFAAGPVVAFSPDGGWLATGHDTANAVLWEIDKLAGPIPRALLAHPGGLTGLHFSADGRRLAGTFAAEAARIWDIADPTHPRPLGHAGDTRRVRAAAIFPDGRWLATAGERVEFWEVSATPVRRMHLAAGDGPLFDVAVAPDGRTMAVGRLDGTVDLWHTIDPSAPARHTSIDAHAGWITSVAFGADGRWLATVSAEHVALWDLRDPTAAIGRIRARLPVTAVAFAPRRGLLAVASLDGSVALLRPTAPVSPEWDGRPASAAAPGGTDADATLRAGAAVVDGAAATAEIPVDAEPLATLRPAGPADPGIDLPGRRRHRRRSTGPAVAVGGAAIGLSTLLVFGHQLGLPPALLLIAGVIVMLALVAASGVALATAVGGAPRSRPRPAGGSGGGDRRTEDREAGTSDATGVFGADGGTRARGPVRRPGGPRSRGAHTRPADRSHRAGRRAVTGGIRRSASQAEPRDAAKDPLNATLPLDVIAADDAAPVDDGTSRQAAVDPDAAATALTEPWPTRPSP